MDRQITLQPALYMRLAGIFDQPVQNLERPFGTHEAIQPYMPPGIQTTEDAFLLAEGRAALMEAFQRPEIVALCTEHDQQQETRRGLGDRLAETPANTLEGVNAKLKVAMKLGRNTDIARSAADDLDRMMREG